MIVCLVGVVGSSFDFFVPCSGITIGCRVGLAGLLLDAPVLELQRGKLDNFLKSGIT